MQTQSQGHTSRSWDSVAGDMAVLQTALCYYFSLYILLYLVSMGYKMYHQCVYHSEIWKLTKKNNTILNEFNESLIKFDP